MRIEEGTRVSVDSVARVALAMGAFEFYCEPKAKATLEDELVALVRVAS